MKAKYTYHLLLATLMLLGGCMVGKKYTAPEQPAAISYRDTVRIDTAKLMGWFDLYNDTALQTIIKTTLDSNRDMLTAAARIAEASLQAAVIKSNLYPQFSYALQAGGGKAGSDAVKVAGGVDGAAFNAFGVLNWEIDIWGKIRHASRAALASYLSSVYNRNALQVSLVAEAASEYFLLRDLDNRLAIAQQTYANRHEVTGIITERFNKGYVAELDKLWAMQQEAIAGATIPSLKRQIVQVENSLRLLMGEGPGTVARGKSIFDQTITPDIPVGLPSQLIERRPDVISAEQSLRSQFEQIGVAQANRLPSFSLTGLLGFASPALSTFLSSKGFVANGFGSLVGPIFNFGKLKNLAEAEKRKFDQVYYQYQQTVLGAFGDVDNALTSYRTYAEEYAQRTNEVDAAAKSLVLSQARYDNGYTAYVEVIVLQNNLFDAQLQQSIALQGKLNSLVQLYKSLGGGW
ncbi:TolC family protein [Danxiaibacter flavus]|uniref:TolC family protein n=1 Tax=Danxiaibacter flavus TaxID=3049108 RepID=A0ABV3ZLY9_9BACT|nr:TolC family protein [Chitinophagaceae bacterium DXS]